MATARKPKTEVEPEKMVGWDHPLVKAGFIPGHLLREAFGYSQNRWSAWVTEHSHLVKTINRLPWFHIDTFMAWAASPENADDLPPVEEPPKVKRTRAR